jgi:hypothetical protein
MTRKLFSVVIVKGEWTTSHGGKYHAGSPPKRKQAGLPLTWRTKRRAILK